MPSASSRFGKISSRTAWSGRWRHYSPSKHHIYLPVMLEYINQDTWIPGYDEFAVCWWELYIYIYIYTQKKNSFDIKKRDNQTLYYEADIQSRTRFHHRRLRYWFINHNAFISGYSCFTSHCEVQSVNRLATTWHYYCCHNLLPLVAHTVECAESFPAWINTLITVLYCAVQVFFSI